MKVQRSQWDLKMNNIVFWRFLKMPNQILFYSILLFSPHMHVKGFGEKIGLIFFFSLFSPYSQVLHTCPLCHSLNKLLLSINIVIRLLLNLECTRVLTFTVKAPTLGLLCACTGGSIETKRQSSNNIRCTTIQPINPPSDV